MIVTYLVGGEQAFVDHRFERQRTNVEASSRLLQFVSSTLAQNVHLTKGKTVFIDIFVQFEHWPSEQIQIFKRYSPACSNFLRPVGPL
jgi:hypothetical protein